MLFFPVLVKQEHVFSWRGSLEAALPEQRAGAVEVTAARVRASPGFWQELNSSRSRRWGDRGHFSCSCDPFLLRGICGWRCPQPKGGASYRHARNTFDMLGQKVIKEEINV